MSSAEHIETCGSLELIYEEVPGGPDDSVIDVYSVRLVEEPNWSASLEVASDWFELSGPGGLTRRLNGSQVQTVRSWVQDHLS